MAFFNIGLTLGIHLSVVCVSFFSSLPHANANYLGQRICHYDQYHSTANELIYLQNQIQTGDTVNQFERFETNHKYSPHVSIYLKKQKKKRSIFCFVLVIVVVQLVFSHSSTYCFFSRARLFTSSVCHFRIFYSQLKVCSKFSSCFIWGNFIYEAWLTIDKSVVIIL